MPEGAGGFWPHGTTVTFDDIEVEGLRTVPLGGGTKGQVDVTSHSSGGRERTVPGLKASESFDIEMLMVPGDAGQAAMIANHAAEGANIVEMVITLPESVLEAGFDQLSWAVDVYVLNWEISLPHDNNPATRTFTFSRESDPVESTLASPES